MLTVYDDQFSPQGGVTQFFKSSEWNTARYLSYIIIFVFICFALHQILNVAGDVENFEAVLGRQDIFKLVGLLLGYSFSLGGLFYWRHICFVHVLNLLNFLTLLDMVEEITLSFLDGRIQAAASMLFIALVFFAVISYVLLQAYREIKAYLLYPGPKAVYS
eukprot:TRINITY_DN13595_c0_g1_i1.p1 TRINITY_DN13595_c0_g1~~TRINITY_DN13595_c0_g1_i1.p1  ORF type:complete len:161 (+),score=26.28 TRINITY_DN13595_c0_g1_i1:56-538(+)